MKLSLIVAVAVLALAHGSLAQDMPNLEKMGQYFENLKNKMTEELTQLMGNPDLASHAQTLQSQMEPIVSKIQEQLKTYATNVEEQIQPMAANVQSQVQPMVDNLQRQMEAIIQKLTEQAKSIQN